MFLPVSLSVVSAKYPVNHWKEFIETLSNCWVYMFEGSSIQDGCHSALIFKKITQMVVFDRFYRIYGKMWGGSS